MKRGLRRSMLSVRGVREEILGGGGGGGGGGGRGGGRGVRRRDGEREFEGGRGIIG